MRVLLRWRWVSPPSCSMSQFLWLQLINQELWWALEKIFFLYWLSCTGNPLIGNVAGSRNEVSQDCEAHPQVILTPHQEHSNSTVGRYQRHSVLLLKGTSVELFPVIPSKININCVPDPRKIQILHSFGIQVYKREKICLWYPSL